MNYTILLINDTRGFIEFTYELPAKTEVLVLWCNPADITGIVEIKNRLRNMQACEFKVLDLKSGGYPRLPQSLERIEYQHIAQTYQQVLTSNGYSVQIVNLLKEI